MGGGATLSCLSKFVHPSAHIRNRYPNPVNGHRLDGLVVLRKESKTIRRKPQMAIVCSHPDFVDVEGNPIELYAVEKHFTITKEGPTELFFDIDENVKEKKLAEDAEGVPVPPRLAEMIARREDVTELRAFVDVDDDNEPCPENVPSPNETPTSNVFSTWGDVHVCYRKMSGGTNVAPSLKCFSRDARPMILQVFEALFPITFLVAIVLDGTNKSLAEKGHESMDYGELLRFIGLWFLMATTHFGARSEFWSRTPPLPFSGAPFRLSDYMSAK